MEDVMILLIAKSIMLTTRLFNLDRDGPAICIITTCLINLLVLRPVLTYDYHIH